MAGNEKERDEVTYEVVEHIGILAAYPTGWKKELNRVAWNGNPPKFDCGTGMKITNTCPGALPSIRRRRKACGSC